MNKLLLPFKSIYDCNLQTASIVLLTLSYVRFLMSAVFINEFGYHSLSESLPIKYRAIVLSSIALSSILYAVTLSGAIMKMVLEDWFGVKLRTVNIILPILGIIVVTATIGTMLYEGLDKDVDNQSSTLRWSVSGFRMIFGYIVYGLIIYRAVTKQISYLILCSAMLAFSWVLAIFQQFDILGLSHGLKGLFMIPYVTGIDSSDVSNIFDYIPMTA
ncbi:hypothetical protein HCN44_000079 [Aphidius gifuensis]|uniref:Uncharacterized protein n=1 Tax=Aphidius gifuensis TaxID=684658 RepID=A0A835CP67_APHGI|nr:hypothetical protein HCN44_000079 [Aphidius gifuensis]